MRVLTHQPAHVHVDMSSWRLIILTSPCMMAHSVAEPVQGARARLKAAHDMLEGEGRRERWTKLHARLTARRCRLAASLGTLFALGPRAGVSAITRRVFDSVFLCMVWRLEIPSLQPKS